MKKILFILSVVISFAASAQINPQSATNQLRIRNGRLQYSSDGGTTYLPVADSLWVSTISAMGNATHTGDATGATGLTVVGINGTILSGLATGILKNTTGTGVPSIAIAADFPTLNQNTTGSAATLTTPRSINGTSFNGSADITVTAAAGTVTGTTLNSTVITSSLTTLGTIATGTWQGTLIAGQYGGTGVNNSGKTFTLGGNLTTAGAFATTFTMTAATGVTFPTSGTLYGTLASSITSAQMQSSVSDETGTGKLVFATSPTFLVGMTLPQGSTSQNPVTWVSGNLKTTAVAAASEYNGSFYDTKASALRYGMGGVIADFYADVSNTTTTETDAFSYTTPVSTLANTGEKIIGTYNYAFTDAATDFVIKVYFGGTQIYTSGTINSFSIHSAQLSVSLTRTGTTTARLVVVSQDGQYGFWVDTISDLTGLTFTNTNILKTTMTASGGSATSGDIVGKSATIYWWPVAAN